MESQLAQLREDISRFLSEMREHTRKDEIYTRSIDQRLEQMSEDVQDLAQVTATLNERTIAQARDLERHEGQIGSLAREARTTGGMAGAAGGGLISFAVEAAKKIIGGF